MSLMWRMALCLFSFLSIESIVGVTLICNTRGTNYSFICFYYVAYLFFIWKMNHFFKLIVVEALYADYFITSVAYQMIQFLIMWFMYVLLMYE